MNSGGTQVGSDTESFPGDGQRLSCKGDNCHELLVGGPASRGVQNLSRSRRIYYLVICGRESAHRWEEGWTHGWRQGILSGSVPLQYTPGTCGPRSQAASFQLRHPPETCRRVVSCPSCRGAWRSPAPCLGASACVLWRAPGGHSWLSKGARSGHTLVPPSA